MRRDGLALPSIAPESPDFEAFRTDLERVKSQAALELVIQRFCRAFGIDLYAFAAMSGPADAPTRYATFNNYAGLWDRYETMPVSAGADPVVQHVRRSGGVAGWSANGKIIGLPGKPPPGARDLLGSAGERGILSGITTPILGEPGTTCFMTFSSTNTRDHRALWQVMPQVFTFANLVHFAWRRVNGKQEEVPALTPQEQRCLSLYVGNRSVREIADVLGITEKTVYVHLANARKRLGSSTLAAACAEARVLRLI